MEVPITLRELQLAAATSSPDSIVNMDAISPAELPTPSTGSKIREGHRPVADKPGWHTLREHPLTLAACVLALLGAGGIIWSHFHKAGRVSYVTAAVTRGTVAPHVTASGTVNPVVTIQVGTYVSGVIQELLCDFNTRVRKNQLCARIDPRPYQTIVDQDEANLGTARAQLAKDLANLQFTQLIYDRDRGLLGRGIISQETLDTANNANRQARSQVALDQASIRQREAELSAAKVNLDYTNIVSPVDGTVVSRNVTQGQTVAASFQTPTLFIIATDLTQMQVDSSVSESDIGAVRVGNDVSFTVDAFPSRVFHGRVVQVRQAPQTVQNVVTYDVVSEAPNPELLLKPGMTTAARIVIEHHDGVLRVPNQAIRYSPATAPAAEQERVGSASHIWLLRDGSPVLVPVVTGLSDESYTEIARGTVNADDPVIVSELSAISSAPAPAPGQSVPRAPRL